MEILGKNMLYLFFIIFLYTPTYARFTPLVQSVSREIANRGFGKTHFIIGAPKTIYTQKNPLDGVAHTKQFYSNRSKITPNNCAYFTSMHDIEKILCDYINEEKKAIDIAVFSLTNKKIAQSLLQSAQKGTRVTIVADKSTFADRFNKFSLLNHPNIHIYEYNPAAKEKKQKTFNDIMHHKFFIFQGDPSKIITGSLNLTNSAVKSNRENITVLHDPHIIKGFKDEFDMLCNTQSRKKEFIDKELRTVYGQR